MVNEFRISWSQSTSDAVQQSFGLTPPAGATIPGIDHQPDRRRRPPRHHDRRLLRRLGPRPHRLARLPAEVPAHQPVRVHRHAVVAARQPRAQVRRRHHRADEEPVHGRAGDARRAALPQRRSPATRWPTTCSATSPTCSCRTSGSSSSGTGRTMFFVQDDWKVNSRAVAEPRPALRLHHAGARSQQRADQLRSGRQRQPDLRQATARCEDRGLVKPDRNNFAPRVGAVYKLDDKTLLRGGWGIFYNLFDRVGSEDQLALNLPGLVNKTITQTSGSPVFFLQQGFPAGFLNAPNLDPGGRAAASGPRSARSPNDAPKTTINQASFGMQRELSRGMVLSRRLRLHARLEPGDAGQPEPAAARTRPATTRSAPLPYPNFGFIEWRAQNGKSDVQGRRPRPREALRAGLRVRRRLHARRFEGQHVRAADDAGVERVPAERARLRARGTDRATTTSATGCTTNFVVDLAARRERLRARLDGVRESTRGARAVPSR